MEVGENSGESDGGMVESGMVEREDGPNRDEDDEETSIPSFPKRQTLPIPMTVWKRIAGAVPDSQRRNMRLGGPGWREGLVGKILAAVQFCQLHRSGLKLILKNPGYKGLGYYATCRTKCVKKAKDGENCGVVIKAYLEEEPDPEADEVEFVVEVVEGDPVQSHYDPAASDPSYHRYLITGDQRKELKTQIASSNLSQTEIAGVLSQRAEMAGSLIHRNLTSAPTTNAIKKIVGELKKEMVLDKDMMLEMELWQLGLEKEELEEAQCKGRTLPASSVRGFVQQWAGRPPSAVLYSEPAVKLGVKILAAGKCRAYLDATGSVVQTLEKGRKTFMYGFVLESVEKSSLNLTDVPILSYFLTRHDTHSISAPLSQYWSAITKRVSGDFSIVNEIVCDYSLATIRALSHTLNRMSVWRYVNLMYELVCGNLTLDEIGDIGIISVCALHVLKKWDLQPGKTRAQRQLNTQYRTMLAKVQMSSNLTNLGGLIQSIAFLATAQVYSQRIDEVLADFEAMGDLDAVLSEALAEMRGVEKESETVEKETMNRTWSESEGEQSAAPTLPIPPNLIHLSKYLEKPQEEDGQHGDAETQLQRSPFYHILLRRLKQGESDAGAHDKKVREQSEGEDVPANPYYLPKISHQLQNHFIHHAPLLTGICRFPERYAKVEGLEAAKKREVEHIRLENQVSGPIAPLYNNRIENIFGQIKRLHAVREEVPLLIPGRQRGMLRLKEVAINLKAGLERNLANLKQTSRSGKGAPFHAITTRVMPSRPREEGGKTVGDEQVVEQWGKKGSRRKRRDAPKFLAQGKRVTRLLPTALVPATLPSSPKRRPATAPLPSTPPTKRKGLTPTTTQTPPFSNVDGFSAHFCTTGARSPTPLSSTEPSEHGISTEEECERGAEPSPGTAHSPSPAPSPGTAYSPSPASPPISCLDVDYQGSRGSPDGAVAGHVVPVGENTDNEFILQLSVYYREHQGISVLEQPHASLLSTRLAAGVKRVPSTIIDMTHRLPPRSMATFALPPLPDTGWQGQYPRPNVHKPSQILPLVWGDHAPGPSKYRPKVFRTCSLDSLLVALIKAEMKKPKRITDFLNSVGRSAIADGLTGLLALSDHHFRNLDRLRLEVASLAGLKPGSDKEWPEYIDLSDAAPDVNLWSIITNFGACIVFALTCDCGLRTDVRPALDVIVDLPLSVGHQLELMLSHGELWPIPCQDCGLRPEKSRIYVNTPNPCLIGVQVHAVPGSENRVGEVWKSLPRRLELERGPAEVMGEVYSLLGLSIYRASDAHNLWLTNSTTSHLYYYDSYAKKKVGRVAPNNPILTDSSYVPSFAIYQKQ